MNPDKVKIIGGWHSILDYFNVLNLKLFEEKTINFDISEAGPGKFLREFVNLTMINFKKIQIIKVH